MSYAQNDAFAGTHDAPNGYKFWIGYMTKHALQPFNSAPRGHYAYRKVGWYWCRPWLQSAIHGPFSSSRKAYKDAMATLAKSEAV